MSYAASKSIKKEEMLGYDYIKKTREYLDYLERHFDNVRKAFAEIAGKCEGMEGIDWMVWRRVLLDVRLHDISKFSEEEFVGYRRAFYPVACEFKHKITGEFEHHKQHNHHHHESLRNNDVDVIHMIIDWMAMGYEFGDTAQEYYERNKDRIHLNKDQVDLMYMTFDRLSAE